MLIQIITLFPNMFNEVLGTSMLKKATDSQAVNFEFVNLRDFGLGPRKSVDDTPFGGGDGMLLMVEPLALAIEAAKQRDGSARVILMSPAGQPYIQSVAKKLVQEKGLIIVCPRYEG